METGNVVEVLHYISKSGDTFDTLALGMYAEERMASVLMDYNRDYIDTLVFPEGVQMKLPIFDRKIAAANMPPWR